MKKKLNILLLISFVLGVAYLIYSAVYWSGANTAAPSDSAEAAGAALASVIVLPHLALTALAVLFNGLGVFLRKSGFALTAGILYAVAIVLFPPYFMFVVLQTILAFVGYAQLKKANKQNPAA